MFDNGEEIVTLEYSIDGCSIKSMPIAVFNRNEKEKTMKTNREVTVTVIREVPDVEPEHMNTYGADWKSRGIKFIQKLILTFWTDKNDYSVHINDIRKAIVDRYGYSEEDAAMFNVACISIKEHHI